MATPALLSACSDYALIGEVGKYTYDTGGEWAPETEYTEVLIEEECFEPYPDYNANPTPNLK